LTCSISMAKTSGRTAETFSTDSGRQPKGISSLLHGNAIESTAERSREHFPDVGPNLRADGVGVSATTPRGLTSLQLRACRSFRPTRPVDASYISLLLRRPNIMECDAFLRIGLRPTGCKPENSFA